MEWRQGPPDVVRSPRAVLGVLAALDLAEFLRLLGSVPDWLGPAVSVGAALVAPRFLLDGLTWLLFLSALLAFAPRLYPERTGLPRRAPGFRVIVSLSSVGIALSLANDRGSTAVLAAIGTVLATCLAFLLYLVLRRGWDLLDAEDPPVGPLEPFAPAGAASEEVRRDLRRSGPLGVLGTALWVAGLATVVTFPCVLAGIVLLVLLAADPLPDLLVLAWVGVGLLGGAVDRFSLPPVPDLEGRIARDVGESARGIQGIFVALFALLGLFLAAGHVLAVVTFGGSTIGLLRLLPTDPLHVSASVAPAICVLAAGGYGIWFWLRELRRIPPFLDYWAGDTTASAAPRPPGLTIPVAAVAIAPIVLAEGFDVAPWTVPTLGLGWPLLVAGLVAVGRSARRFGRHSLAGEDHAIALSLAIQLLELWVLGAAGSLASLYAGRLPLPLGDPTIPLFVVLLLLLSLYPNVDRHRASMRGALGRYGRSVYLLFLGLFAGVTAAATSTLLAALLGIVAGTCLVGSVGLALTTYFDL